MDEFRVPADVPKEMVSEYKKNYLLATKGKNKLMLYACDQKIEHLNDDFYGEGIAEDDADPEHLFRIGSKSTIGVMAAQYGLIANYGMDHRNINYIVKLNSKTHLVKTAQKDPISDQLVSIDQVMKLKKNSGLNIVGVGFTIYIGSEFENDMMMDASRIIHEAHQHGLFVVLWMYPRGKAVKDEKDPHLIAGAAGVGACLGAEFVKVNYPKKEGVEKSESLKEAVMAAGRTGLICAGGSSTDAKKFFQDLHDQIHISGARGNATGRNIHQRELFEAIRMCDAISSITYGDKDVEFAIQVYEGKEKFKM